MRIISLLTFIFCLPYALVAAGEEPSVATQLGDHYLKSFGPEETKAGPYKKATKTTEHVTEIHISPREERAIVFNEIFAKSRLYQDKYKQLHNVLNQYAWNDLHLFCGTTTTPGYHLLTRINKTITVLGEGALASLISAPITNLEELTKRQQLIALFGQEPQVSSDFKKELQNYKASEKGMLSLWSETDPLYTKEYSEYVSSLFYTNSPASNKDASSLQMRKFLLRDVWNIYSNYIWYPLLGVVLGEAFVIPFSNGNNIRDLYYSSFFPMFLPIYGVIHVRKEATKLDSIAPYIPPGVFTISSFWQYYRGYCNYKEYSGILKNLALRMADVQTFLSTAKKINALVKNNPQLEVLCGQQLPATRTLLACVKTPSELGNLLSYLEELPLRSWSYLCNNAGKLLASYKLFVEYKAVFHDAMYELGQVDAFLSIATLMDDTRAMDTPHAYTFTRFLSPQAYAKPRLVLDNMWNPMLEPMAAVGNDITMDAQTGTQNIILTGPNAGGKSTFLTGVTQAILLSQTFGIAPAHACEMTPFRKINTYIDVTDDIAAGKSLFMAEACRFKEHLDLLKLLKKEEFSFTIFDEPFSGTNPIEGGAAEYSVLNSISKYTNTFNIVATHYPIVMLLEHKEPTKGFKNYKVFINHKGRGQKIEYTYKVVPGESNQTIAIDILEEEGYATDMLEQARDIIKNPEKYLKSFSEKNNSGAIASQNKKRGKKN